MDLIRFDLPRYIYYRQSDFGGEGNVRLFGMTYLSNVVTLEFDTEKCTGCGICLEVCPHRLLFLSDGKIAVTDIDRCIECGACARNCAFGAIQVEAGVGCAAALIASKVNKTGEITCGCDCEPEKGKISCC